VHTVLSVGARVVSPVRLIPSSDAASPSTTAFAPDGAFVVADDTIRSALS
jgi:hypothetical protein